MSRCSSRRRRSCSPGSRVESLTTNLRVSSCGTRLEQRAAAAGLCEPVLLTDEVVADGVLAMLDTITATLSEAGDRRTVEYAALKKALGHGWSVAVVAAPARGKRQMEQWSASANPDIHWIMRENIKKNRFVRLDAVWVERMKAAVEES